MPFENLKLLLKFHSWDTIQNSWYSMFSRFVDCYSIIAISQLMILFATWLLLFISSSLSHLWIDIHCHQYTYSIYKSWVHFLFSTLLMLHSCLNINLIRWLAPVSLLFHLYCNYIYLYFSNCCYCSCVLIETLRFHYDVIGFNVRLHHLCTALNLYVFKTSTRKYIDFKL